MKGIRRTAAAVAVTAFIFAGCSSDKDSTGPNGGGIDQIAAMELTFVFFDFFDLFWDEVFGPDAAISTDILLANTQQFQETIPCDGSGTMNMQVTLDDNLDQDGTGSISMSATQTPNNCRVVTESHGALTMNGNPNISLDATMNLVEGLFTTMNMQLSGGFNWTGAGGSGSCNMNITYAFSETSFSVNGNMCGNPINIAT